ncbi:MAG TPA: YoaK family protein [Rudaea sp.]|nr:YoaK family protein [Rudaea sp.]
MNGTSTKTAGDKLEFPSGLTLSTLLAFAAGFVDTCGFIMLFGLFTAHVTGNFVLIGDSLAESRPGIYAKLLAFPAFMIVVAITRFYLLHCERRQRDPTRSLLVAQVTFLALFLATGVIASPIRDADAPFVILIGIFGVTAMAIQNVASRTVFAAYAPTTIMTGNVTQVVMDLVELPLRADAAQAKARLHKMIPPVIGFAAGAIASGLAVAWVGFWALLCPLLVMALVCVTYYRSTSP